MLCRINSSNYVDMWFSNCTLSPVVNISSNCYKIVKNLPKSEMVLHECESNMSSRTLYPSNANAVDGMGNVSLQRLRNCHANGCEDGVVKEKDSVLYPTDGVRRTNSLNIKTEATETIYSSKSVDDALEIIEKRKKTINAKLLSKRENLTQEEEQDIHTRADLYAITTIPDQKYYVLPENDLYPNLPGKPEQIHIDAYQPSRKKRRRNYGNTNCYVHHHNHEDVYDNTKMLPIGTRLMKPPTKLVELVAQAITGSPDGLLQVQQIYIFLQNRYPFFRYMDMVAINSWRSSIRHALYQKWFRKIRFDLSYISSKGCYWAINHKSNPKDWSLPDQGVFTTVKQEFYRAILSTEYDEQETKEVAAIARDLLSHDPCTKKDCLCDNGDDDKIKDKSHNVPSPVKELDPILSTCAEDWTQEDIYLSSNKSSHGTVSPSFNSPHFCSMNSLSSFQSPDLDSNSDQQLKTSSCFRYNYDMFPVSPKSQTVLLSSNLTQQTMSPMFKWTPNWDEYGSYILSPQNIATQKYILGLPGGQQIDINGNNSSFCTVRLAEAESAVNGPYVRIGSLSDSEEGSQKFVENSDSGSCDFEVIAEFNKFDSQNDIC